MGKHHIQGLIDGRCLGKREGIYSVCSANPYVIEAAMLQGLERNHPVLIEATANQVNQFGGYTGMKPADFRDFVYRIATRTRIPVSRIILGGDHLGPLTWKEMPESEAMGHAENLVHSYVTAGFSKIHLDTSMRLGDDDPSAPLAADVIAARGARLCRCAEEAYQELLGHQPDAQAPVYVIGSEVPVPGGPAEEEAVTVTTPKDFLHVVQTYETHIRALGLHDAWDRVVAVVVQPGVEFSDDSVSAYQRQMAAPLMDALQRTPRLVFEGHSTDYQSRAHLRQMVEDGIAILKVGPALTFALREALFLLGLIEVEVASNQPLMAPSRFMEQLDRAMVKNPKDWRKYYHGGPERLRYARRYSLSDRTRYYLPLPEVQHALDEMLANLREVGIPMALLSQFLPNQFLRVREGLLGNDPEAILIDRIRDLMDDYEYAISGGNTPVQAGWRHEAI